MYCIGTRCTVRLRHTSSDHAISVPSYVLLAAIRPALSFKCALLCLQTSIAEAHCGGLESVGPLPYGKVSLTLKESHPHAHQHRFVVKTKPAVSLVAIP